jgi:hypothetical protein
MFETSIRPQVISANDSNPQCKIQLDLRWIIGQAVTMDGGAVGCDHQEMSESYFSWRQCKNKFPQKSAKEELNP